MHHRFSEKGQALVLITLAAVGLFAFAGLAIDGGRIFSERRHAQNAADNAAMAAVVALCRSGDHASAGLAMANLNGYNDNSTTNWVTVNSPPISGTYVGQSGYVEVNIESQIPSTIVRVVYNGPLKAYARAVARCGTSSTGTSSIPYDPNVFRGVWAGASSGCNSQDYFLWGGNNYTITGGIHSNQDMQISGNNSTVTGPSTVVGGVTGSGDDMDFDPELDDDAGSLTDPFTTAYTFARFNNTGGGDIYNAAAAVGRVAFTTGKIEAGWLKTSCWMHGERCLLNSVLQDGIYVTSYSGADAIDIGDGSIHGDGGSNDFANVTFVTNEGGIKFSGSTNKFNPYIGNANAADSTAFLQGLHGILAATWGHGPNQCTDSIFYISGSSLQLGGFIYAPDGQVEMAGSNNVIIGCTIGNTAKLNGSDYTITCDGTWFPQPVTNNFVALIE